MYNTRYYSRKHCPALCPPIRANISVEWLCARPPHSYIEYVISSHQIASWAAATYLLLFCYRLNCFVSLTYRGSIADLFDVGQIDGILPEEIKESRACICLVTTTSSTLQNLRSIEDFRACFAPQPPIRSVAYLPTDCSCGD